MSVGKVYFVGAGPGDLELITIKGYRLVCDADVILHDHLIPLELLDIARPDAEVISVGKFASNHTLSQDQINELLVEKAKQGKIVVRLKGGDPYIFGRGGEEALVCVEARVDFEVVPGVTSPFAAACYGGIPPTHRDCTSNIALVTGHRKEKEQLEIPKAGTVIFLMGVGNIEKIIARLLEDGWAKETKIAAVEHGTRYDQRVITGTLENFLEIAKEKVLRMPAVFIVGKVVELQEKLSWFTKKPNVLILGNYPQRYQRLGNIVHRRIIDCVPLDDYSALKPILEKIDTFNWIAFTSANGVRNFFEQLYLTGKDTRSLAKTKIAVIGKTTSNSLKQFGISADVVPEDESSKGMLEEFSKLDMNNKKVLLPQSEIASEELPNGLLGMQAEIEKAAVYKTIDTDPGEIDFDYIDQILFTSGSTVRAFIKRFGKVPKHIKSYCLGQPTLNEAKKHNIKAEIIPD